MSHHDCDAFFSVDPIDNAYLTGFFGTTSALLLTASSTLFLCDFRYSEQALAQVDVAEVLECKGNLDVRLAEQMAQLQLQRIAFEPETLSVARYETICSQCGGMLVSAAGICRNLRIRKDVLEVERLAAAQSLAEEALEATVKELRAGVTECSIAARLEYEFRLRGAQAASFDTIVLFGERSSLPHGKPGDRRLTAGDVVLIDCGCILDGYCSDLTRTFIFGRIPGDWFSEIYEITRVAQKKALLAARAGVSAREVDAAARGTISAADFGDNFGHGTGHGVGLEVHEAPRLNAGSEAVLETGMAVTVEPGIYLPGRGGVRIEDLIVITADGNRNLNHLSKELRTL